MLEGFSIKDEKAGMFSPPFFVKNIVIAVRSVLATAQDPATMLSKYPGDFALYRVCEFDEETGDVADASPSLITTISQLLKGGTDGQATSPQRV